mmetsp:Transcript_118308/g.331376  ORF Transcript_118308/g.331376 Transcript_118308/m.331376 type:complete len:285 (+) Transcript_118308:186-1040(+)
MASFGRRPAKGMIGASSSVKKANDNERSHTLKQLQEEEAERERFAQEFQAREQREREAAKQEAKVEREERQERERLEERRRGQPNPQVFLEVEIRSHRGLVASGRMDFELYADKVPKTAENFRCLCTGEKGKKLHFKDTMFHRIIPGFMAQGGDITNGDGTGGMSIYGPRFRDENFERRHERPGVLSMANCGKDTNNSQFFVLFKSAPHLDHKHVVFGGLIGEEGQILKKLEECGSQSGDVKGEVSIANCGEITNTTAPRKRDLSRSRSRGRGKGRSKGGNIID